MKHIIPEAYTFDDLQIVPKYSKVLSRSDCELTTNISHEPFFKIGIPIVSSPMDTVTEHEMAYKLWQLGGVGFIHRFMTIQEQVDQVDLLRKKIRDDYIERHLMPYAVTDSSPQVGIGTRISDQDLYAMQQLVAVSIGITGDYFQRAQKLFDRGVKVFLFDVAHGHHLLLKRAVMKLRKKYGNTITIIGGNIATANAAKDLIEWGVDVLRVGIGNGSLCETRIRAGVGIPQATSIADVARVARGKATIIADGGIRTPGDAAKAIGLGADMVMLGSLLAGTKETPGRLIRVGNFPNEQLFKQYRGSASQSSKLDRGEEDSNVEGNSKIIPYKGKVKRIIDAITDGLKSAMSYVGAENIEEFRKNIEFVQVTQAGQIEAKPHLLLK
jgi:IMP dehydrogenase